MARPTGNRPIAQKPRKRTPGAVAAPVAAGPVAASSVAAPKRPFNMARFANEVRAEARKITWTSRKETWITSVMVFIMVLTTSLFFFVADLGLSWSINQILKLAR
jgi:preprotein translocase subunit SecE